MAIKVWSLFENFKLSELNANFQEVYAISSHYNGVAHNTLYRGKYLGTSVTATQYTAISAGTFEDLYIGDYWTIGGVNYRIAAFDYYWNCGYLHPPAYQSDAIVISNSSLTFAGPQSSRTYDIMPLSSELSIMVSIVS